MLGASPATARSSGAGDGKTVQKVLRTVGDDLTNELVEWFNQVDATYRSDLRELNELNFARFDAKLEQRAAELEAKLGERMPDDEGMIFSAAAHESRRSPIG